MINKLLTYYQDSITKNTPPDENEWKEFYWFQSNLENEWIGVPMNKVRNDELTLLKTLFLMYEPPQNNSSSSKKWYDFLFSNGPIPPVELTDTFYCIHFKLSGTEWEKNDIEMAIRGFFQDDTIIVWYSNQQGVLIDKNNHFFVEENYYSLIQSFESDFLVKVYLYIGGAVSIDEDLPKKIKQDIVMFEQSIELIPKERVFQFEKVFPSFLISKMKKEFTIYSIYKWTKLFEQEPDLHTTIKVYLENNSNASLTAKKLYIHRNTLQYRIDKFTEKTGINLKDFNSALTVYLSCLYFEQLK